MKEIKIDHLTENQRFDKFLMRLFPLSSKGNIYKMLRKKAIELNERKAKGSETLRKGDVVSLFLSDESIHALQPAENAVKNNHHPTETPSILYEDENIVMMVKEAGMLAHKAHPKDRNTLNDQLLHYLSSQVDLLFFTPGIANRLDRNTSGIVLAGKNLPSSQALQEQFKKNTIKRYYQTIVHGNMIHKDILEDGYSRSKGKTNIIDGSDMITHIYPLAHFSRKGLAYSHIEVEIITGKTHQIRSQLEKNGYPLLGDRKYGGRKTGFSASYFLHGEKVQFTEKTGFLGYLAGKTFVAPKPKKFRDILDQLKNK